MLIGLWLGSAITGVPLIILEAFGLSRRLSISTVYLKFAIDQLLTSETRSLMLWSLMILGLSSLLFLALFFYTHRLAENGRDYERKNRRRQKRAGSLDFDLA